MKRSRLKKKGSSKVSVIKDKIQGALRAKAFERDKTCVIGQNLHMVPLVYRECGPFRNDGEMILQAEHLVGRANSASYADMDNIVLICQRHHFYFKKQHPLRYAEIIKKHIGPERWQKVQDYEQNMKPTHMVLADWKKRLDELI